MAPVVEVCGKRAVFARHSVAARLARLLLVAFVLNLVWENLQAPLFEGFQSHAQHFRLCLAAAVWDGVIVATLYLAVAWLRNDLLWSRHAVRMDWIVLIALGALVAIAVEAYCLKTGRYSYGSGMPTAYGIGVVPVLQMMLTPFLTLLVAEKLSGNSA